MSDHIGCTSLLVIALIVYVIFIRPKLEDRERDASFDNLVLGVIDGLVLADIPVGFCISDLRSFVKGQLASAHKLPDTEALINYTAANGYRYSSYLGSGNHTLFAVLCLVRYAIDTSRPELLEWCESNLERARRN